MDRILRDFEAYLAASGASPSTIESRVRSIRLLARFAGVDDPRQVTTMDVMRWVASVPASWSRTTYFGHAASWARFLRLTEPGTDLLAGLTRPRSRRGLPRPIDTDELMAALTVADGRTRTMILLGAYEGFRVSEIARVCGDDVNEQVIYVEGKGGHRAFVDTHPLIWAEAQRYPRHGWWFPSPEDPRQPVCRTTVWRSIKLAFRAVGSDAKPHQLRHWYGTNLLRGGANARVVQELMRHQSLETTAIYTLVSGDQRRHAVDALPLPAPPVGVPPADEGPAA